MTASTSLYEAAAHAAWQLPSTQRLFRDDQEASYVALMTDRPDFRALVDAVRRQVLAEAADDLRRRATAIAGIAPDSTLAKGIRYAAAELTDSTRTEPAQHATGSPT